MTATIPKLSSRPFSGKCEIKTKNERKNLMIPNKNFLQYGFLQYGLGKPFKDYALKSQEKNRKEVKKIRFYKDFSKNV